jgi:hypothetical protein
MYLGVKEKSLVVEFAGSFVGVGDALDCFIEKVRNDGMQMTREKTYANPTATFARCIVQRALWR